MNAKTTKKKQTMLLPDTRSHDHLETSALTVEVQLDFL